MVRGERELVRCIRTHLDGGGDGAVAVRRDFPTGGAVGTVVFAQGVGVLALVVGTARPARHGRCNVEAVDRGAFVWWGKVALALVAVLSAGTFVAAGAAVVGVVSHIDAAVTALVVSARAAAFIAGGFGGAGSSTGTAVVDVGVEELVALEGAVGFGTEGLGVGAVAFAAFCVGGVEGVAADGGGDCPVVEVGGFEAGAVDQVVVPVIILLAPLSSHAVVELAVAALKGAAITIVTTQKVSDCLRH